MIEYLTIEIALKKLAKIYFSFSEEQLTRATHVSELVEVH